MIIQVLSKLIGLLLILTGTCLTALAISNIYEIALETYHVGYLFLWTLILFIGFGLVLFGYRIIRRKKTMCVTIEYTSAYPDPLKLAKGQELSIGKKESEWPGWVWCTDHNNISGWVPESYVRINENRAIILRDYDATELTVRPGDRVNITKEVSGWYLCLDQKGNKGWVPRENFE